MRPAMLSGKLQFDMLGKSTTVLREQVAADGFAIIADVISPREIGRLIQEIRAHPLPRSRAGVRHAMRHETIAAFVRQPSLAGLATEILGTTAIPFRATLFDKSPGSNWLVVWHQDTALPIQHRRDVPGWGPWSTKDGITYAHAPAAALEKIIALRVHLDDSTAENGPLRVLPATHKIGVLEDDAIHELASDLSPVDCVVAIGGVIAMKPLVVHASSKSRSDHPRRVLHIEYAPSLVLHDGLELAIA
jgi:ectoine hydroxylase-related dioxygenase (phytanoyl-CoA dioxygenase family)